MSHETDDPQPMTLIARLASWLNRVTPEDGLLLGGIRGAVGWLEPRTSLNWAWRAWTRKRFPRDVPNGKTKSPAWASEVYLLGALILGICALTLVEPTTRLVSLLGPIVYVWPMYRLWELALFVFGWLFAHDERLHSVPRSLLGFLLNILEVALLTTVLLVATGSSGSNPRWKPVYENVVAVVSIEAPSLPPDSASGLVQLMRFALGFFIVLCAVGSLAGGVLRRTVKE